MDKIAQMKERDYVLVIDQSGSMSEKDTPTSQTRWAYAQESTEAIARKCEEWDPDGITVMRFNSGFQTYENTTAAKVKSVFKEGEPSGGTILAPVLKNIFDGYLAQKKAGNAKSNGVVALVVTDGEPQDKEQVAQEIIKFTKNLDREGEFGLSFIQVGRDEEATKFLHKLDDDLEKLGAKYDIVSTKTMADVESVGLTQTLYAAIEG